MILFRESADNHAKLWYISKEQDTFLLVRYFMNDEEADWQIVERKEIMKTGVHRANSDEFREIFKCLFIAFKIKINRVY